MLAFLFICEFMNLGAVISSTKDIHLSPKYDLNLLKCTWLANFYDDIESRVAQLQASQFSCPNANR